jgi:trigger factor
MANSSAQPSTDKTAKQLPEINRLADGTIEINQIIDKEKIKTYYNQALDRLQQETEIKGFRKGKAPRERVERALGQDRIYQLAIDQLLPEVYQETVSHQQLKPIIAPRAELVSAQENQDWQIKFITCELPQIDLGDYKQIITQESAKEAIWTPDKNTPADKKTAEDEDKLAGFQKKLDILAKTVKVKLPQILLDNDVNRKLAGLIEKTEKMGLSLEQYLTAIGQNADSLKKEYQEESGKNWRLELALNKIADEEKIIVTDQDVDEALNKIENEKERQDLANQRYMLSSMIRRQKTLEFIQSL